MRSEEIRNTYLEFFREKGHKIVPSAPIVIKNDPTLLFTNAGMNQFKDYFLGNKEATEKRIADTQKCLRASGKHNDLDDVGRDTYHHTMFEMLGNWSFGDYFKKNAIQWAWELLTERYKLDKGRLYVSVFEGSEEDGMPEDSEARNIWKELIDEDRILNFSKKDNFWEMGDTGPCGPCSEIHFDMRSDEDRARTDGRLLVNNDDPQVIEIWNLVFIQFNRKADGSLESLPAKHVDTGMGFERLTRVLQGKHSNYDTDIFQPMIRKMETDLKLAYGKSEETDIAFRVIADHIRAATFSIADGQLPSNTGAGYVIRRILRRAVRYGYSFLGMEEPYIYQLVTVLAQQFKNIFPEVIKQESFIKKVVQEEEASFLRTLASGNKLFEKHLEGLKGDTISGKFAFELYDTFGFPFDLTSLMAKEQGLNVDEAGFKEELGKQKDRSRQAANREETDWIIVNPGEGLTMFTGYENLRENVNLIRYRKVSDKEGTVFHAIFDKTPFYPEGGGQIGDTGTLSCGEEVVNIIDTIKENDLIIHVLDKLPSNPAQSMQAVVEAAKRNDTANNHSATHLLHAALRQVLGSHVAQKGSLVHERGLRFDFSHFSKVTDDEISRVEHIVNEKIRENIPLIEKRDISFAEAQQRGAMALFGEKYGERVRMITFDPAYSIELCGGIHVPATGRLGYFKITSESAVAAGVRRIEAVTGAEAEKLVNSQFQLVKQIKEALKNPQDLLGAIEQLKEQNKALQHTLDKVQSVGLKQLKEELLKKANQAGQGISLISETVALDSPDAGKNLVFDIKNEIGNGIVILGAAFDGKANLWISIPEEISKAHGLHAGNIIREIAGEIEGGGGGQPFFATAGGKRPEGLQAAVDKGKSIILSKLN